MKWTLIEQNDTMISLADFNYLRLTHVWLLILHFLHSITKYYLHPFSNLWWAWRALYFVISFLFLLWCAFHFLTVAFFLICGSGPECIFLFTRDNLETNQQLHTILGQKAPRFSSSTWKRKESSSWTSTHYVLTNFKEITVLVDKEVYAWASSFINFFYSSKYPICLLHFESTKQLWLKCIFSLSLKIMI